LEAAEAGDDLHGHGGPARRRRNTDDRASNTAPFSLLRSQAFWPGPNPAGLDRRAGETHRQAPSNRQTGIPISRTLPARSLVGAVSNARGTILRRLKVPGKNQLKTVLAKSTRFRVASMPPFTRAIAAIIPSGADMPCPLPGRGAHDVAIGQGRCLGESEHSVGETRPPFGKPFFKAKRAD